MRPRLCELQRAPEPAREFLAIAAVTRRRSAGGDGVTFARRLITEVGGVVRARRTERPETLNVAIERLALLTC